MKGRDVAWIGAALIPAIFGCADPLTPAQRIDTPRVLGVRLVSARGFASLDPAQAATADILLAGPDGPVDARVAYRVCEATVSQRGVPGCAHAPFAEDSSQTSDTKWSFDVPATLRPATPLALLGVACPRGEPTLAEEPLAWGCSDDDVALRFTFDAHVSAAEPKNNPELSALSLRLAGEPLRLSDANTAPTCVDETPSVPTSAKVSFELTWTGPAQDSPSNWQLSHFSTRGEFERQYSFVSPESPSSIALDWSTPGDAGPVKQYLVARDGQGGVSWISWDVCVR